VGSDALNKPHLLGAVGVIDTALQDAAAVAVSANFDAVLADSIEDEGRIGSAQLVQTLLNDVVAVEVLNKLDDLMTKGLNDEVHLSRRGHMLDHLLEGSSTMLIQGDANHLRGGVLNENGALLVTAELDELLAQVVTEGIHHQLYNVLVNLEPNHVDLSRNAVLQLLLKVAAAMLILAQGVNVTSALLERKVVITSHGYDTH